ncbi:MAG: aminomethyl-transferring glycine dehydrogenase subunit GcvPB [Muribaculaceae bacterium]|nr:aminomethyl-transferring glycine dehydrogenase subunit GcvPB [Muribaculaceae bacterium]
MNKQLYSTLIFELSRHGRRGHSLPGYGTAKKFVLPEKFARKDTPALPEVEEPAVVRHYTNSSTNNFGVDTGFYPLGSCTMKYNPKINEAAVRLSGISDLHPATPDACAQGALEIYRRLQELLSEMGGMSEFSLNPYAGAHGELTGLMVVRTYHASRGEGAVRRKVIVPDSAHGTNPASAAIAGYDVVECRSLPDGTVDVEDLRSKLGPDVAAVMMTNPNTVGMFEKNIPAIAEAVHACGALMYYDGANLNALLGVARPGDMGFDVMHINLHKTFSTPHGGGGPGAGPIGVRKGLERFLPMPRVVRGDDGMLRVLDDSTETPFERTELDPLGRVSSWLGNYAVFVKALAYILSMGKDIEQVGPLACLNANYILNSLKEMYELPIPGPCKHEMVFDGLRDKSTGCTTMNVAKRLLDMGFHAPTIYFPLLFHESLMIEPTETESRETLDVFINAMRAIAREAAEDPETLKNAPLHTPVRHPDENEAALHPKVTYQSLAADEV